MKLPKGHTELSKDARPITAIVWPNETLSPHFKVGQSGVTSIEAYDENGHMASIPWLAIFKGDEIVLRTPACHVAISYA